MDIAGIIYFVFPAIILFFQKRTEVIQNRLSLTTDFKKEMDCRMENLLDIIHELRDDEMKYLPDDFAEIQDMAEKIENQSVPGIIWFYLVARLFDRLTDQARNDILFQRELTGCINRVLVGLEKYPVIEDAIWSNLNIIETIVMNISVDEICQKFNPRIQALRSRNKFLKAKIT